MGFLSKLFGADAGPTSGKAADEPSSAPGDAALRNGSPAVNEVVVSPPRDDVARGEPAPVAAAAPVAVAAPAAPVAAIAAAAPVAVAPPRKPGLNGGQRPGSGKVTPLGSPAAYDIADTRNSSKTPARPLRWNGERPPPPGAATEASAPVVPRRAPETPRRSAQLESSIITSAPLLGTEAQRVLGTEAQRAPASPRPGVAADARTTRSAGVDLAGAAGTEPAHAGDLGAPVGTADGAYRAAMSSLGDQAGLLGTRRKDRSKSPGFYSNLAPAYGSQVINSGATQASVRRTFVGLAPPSPGAGTVAPVVDDTSQAPVEAPATAGASGANPAAPELASPVSEASDGALAPAPDSAPPQGATDELEKEQTAPGVGHMPSRYDPTARGEIPERDLDLLVQFAMDLSLGLASEAWLTAVREAVLRLGAAAVKLGRAALDKALVQLRVDLDAPNALSDERRGRLAQQLVLVDLALPRPVDVSGQRLVRERLIVQHITSELSVAYPLVAQRLRDEGTLTLDRFARIDALELAQKAGLYLEQAEQALLPFREYLLKRAQGGPEPWLRGKAQGLEQRLSELEASAHHFESVADGDDVQHKREARRQRQADIARVGLFLAEWGEAGILGELERCSVQGKIARLRRWLAELPAS